MKPMESRACCCARASRGQGPSDTTLTANVVMKSRRFTLLPRGFVLSYLCFVDCEGTAAQLSEAVTRCPLLTQSGHYLAWGSRRLRSTRSAANVIDMRTP